MSPALFNSSLTLLLGHLRKLGKSCLKLFLVTPSLLIFLATANAQAYKCVADHMIGYEYDEKRNLIVPFIDQRPFGDKFVRFIVSPSSIGVSTRDPWVVTAEGNSPLHFCNKDFVKNELLCGY
jgi:hypothetical protein